MYRCVAYVAQCLALLMAVLMRKKRLIPIESPTPGRLLPDCKGGKWRYDYR